MNYMIIGCVLLDTPYMYVQRMYETLPVKGTSLSYGGCVIYEMSIDNTHFHLW